MRKVIICLLLGIVIFLVVTAKPPEDTPLKSGPDPNMPRSRSFVSMETADMEYLYLINEFGE